jgi:penicillin-binding protein 2
MAPRRQRISSSPLKRLESEEKELRRRSQPVHPGVRLSLMGIVVLGLFSMMIVRLWSLQVLQGPTYQRLEHRLTTKTVAVAPPRGLILSRNGDVLVANRVMPVVTLDRHVAANNPDVIEALAVALGVSVSTIDSDLADQQDSLYEPVPVAVAPPESVLVGLSEHKAEYPGVTISYVAERTYPDADVGAQMLGYVADITADELKQLKKDGYLPSDVVGQSGVEEQYEKWLRGTPGKQELQVDALGDPVGTVSVRPPAPGDDVVLNVDLGLEKIVQAALAKQIAKLHSDHLPADSGAAVVIDPQDGAVLAMASYPTYDPSWWVGGMSTAHYEALTRKSSGYPLLNRAIQGLYQPGSTFKLATATAALDHRLISPTSLISDPGYFTIPGCTGGLCTFHNNAGESCGSCNVTTALTISDDVFFYTLGYYFWVEQSRYGEAPIQNAAASYGLGRPSGIDLPAESYGQLDSPLLRKAQHAQAPDAFPNTYYGPGDNVEMAFGQGETTITPLQLADAYATFANGGTRYAPEVAAAVVSPSGKLIKTFKPKVEGHVHLPTATYRAIFAGLKGVITSPGGTAYATFANQYPYAKLPLAGKTGTATTSSSATAQPTALFVAFGPATGNRSAPRYCAAVVIPEAGYGAAAAAPVVKSIFTYLAGHGLAKLDLGAPVGGG